MVIYWLYYHLPQLCSTSRRCCCQLHRHTAHLSSPPTKLTIHPSAIDQTNVIGHERPTNANNSMAAICNQQADSSFVHNQLAICIDTPWQQHTDETIKWWCPRIHFFDPAENSRSTDASNTQFVTSLTTTFILVIKNQLRGNFTWREQCVEKLLLTICSI